MADTTYARYGTLVAATVTTISPSKRLTEVVLHNRDGASDIFYTTTGVAPTVEGDDCGWLPAAICSVRIKLTQSGDTTIKLISAGTPKYGVSA